VPILDLVLAKVLLRAQRGADAGQRQRQY